MLTRIEIDGFKTFRGFALDVPPLLTVVGRNAAGKSNLFDALQFLRLLATEPLLHAVQHTRGDLAELLHRYADGSHADRMRFAVEVLLDGAAVDAFGDRAVVTHSRLRYEVEIEARRVDLSLRPFVVDERVQRIRKADDRWIRQFPPQVAERLAVYSLNRKPLLDVDADPERPRFKIYQQGSQGQPRQLPAADATATALSSITTANDFPLLFALQREIANWRLLHLDPTALRMADSYDDPDSLSGTGQHLPNTLRRVSRETGTGDRPEGVLNDISADLASVVAGIQGVRISDDPGRRQRQVEVLTNGEAPFLARVSSDGTLRTVALLAALYEPRGAGLVCFEEPENGVFPQRLQVLMRHLRTQVERGLERRISGAAETPVQLVVSSHSPAILHTLSHDPGSLVQQNVIWLDAVTRTEGSGRVSRVTRWRAVRDRVQPLLADPEVHVVSDAEIAAYEVRESLGDP
ncbi:hypothetical protein GCM10010124_09980 [Pilimelia terevasa]|uniref:ATPase AAA-type core domain-containing protein n=1 Tax=Pilimelia terevasa TaxID=53372 RepID=A0A8J3BJR3_9ACTN|nr:AAA family ATPase [Pilimelia terevasa]GGK19375.1 hypothetical protein GCM10010124_09980 [Pilimelia terevasa]